MRFRAASPFIRPHFEVPGLLIPRKFIDGQFAPVQRIQMQGGDIGPTVSDRGPSALIDRTIGTNIGNMTAAGGLAAAFDGNTNQDRGACARKTSAAANSGYVGKSFPTPTAIESILAFGSNSHGYVDTNPGTVTLTIWGKQGAAPASGTDGTAIGSITFADTNNESVGRTITSTDNATYWNHVWVNMTQPENQGISIAELQMTGWVS